MPKAKEIDNKKTGGRLQKDSDLKKLPKNAEKAKEE